MTWSEAFAAYLKRHGIKQSEVALVLGVSPASVTYWLRGREPRREVRRRIDAWSRGEIPYAPWREPASSVTLTEDDSAQEAG